VKDFWRLFIFMSVLLTGGCGYGDDLRIAREGALLTDYYAQQSCTAGRAALHGASGAGK